MSAVHPIKSALSACLLSSTVGIAAMLGACGVDDAQSEAPASSEGRLLAALELPNQRALRFHEPEEGMVITSERGSIAHAGPGDPAEQGLDPVQLYEYLAHRPAPAALVDALARAQPREGRVPDDAPASIVLEPASGRIEKGDVRSPGIERSRGWFDGALCQPTDRNHLWKDATGDSSVRTKGTNYFKTGAYAVTGTVTFRVNRWDCGIRQCSLDADPWPDRPASGASRTDDAHIFTLATGTYAWARIDCKNCTVEAKITEADGDLYDFCTNFHY